VKAGKLPKFNVGEETFAFYARAFKLPPFVREYRFHETRQWRLDFAWPQFRVGVEIQGGVWRPGGGAHSRPGMIERDMEKHNALVMRGWWMLLVTPKQVQDGSAMQLVDELLRIVQGSGRGETVARGTDGNGPSPGPLAYVPPSSPSQRALIDFELDT